MAGRSRDKVGAQRRGSRPGKILLSEQLLVAETLNEFDGLSAARHE